MKTSSVSLLKATATALPFLFAITTLNIATPGQAFLTTSTTNLRKSIESMVEANKDKAGTVGIYVVDAQTSRVLVDINGNKAMVPASNNKLRTTAAALALLGEDFRYSTDLLTTTSADDRGVLPGDIIVRGGGDPTLSGRFEKEKTDVTGPLRELAKALKAKGITEVAGGLLLDDTYFDRDYFHSGWYKSERGEWYEAEIWGLSFNDGCVDLTWSGKGLAPGDLASVTMNPQTDYVRLDNQVRVAAKGRPSERYYTRADQSNDIIASGTITVDSSKVDSATVWNGPLFFASVFRDVLTSEGITVRGNARLLDPREVEKIEADAQVIASHKSPPLTDVVNTINRVSQNYYADTLIKTLGKVKGGTGSYAAGVKVIDDYFKKAGIYMAGNVIVDGSGLAAENMVSPRQLVETIRLADTGAHKAAWRDSLPIGSTRGSLKSRFQQTTQSRTLSPNIMGKTGLIGGVRTLSGIAKNHAGRDVYYSIMLNDFKFSGARAIEFLDEVAVAIAASEDKPAPVQMKQQPATAKKGAKKKAKKEKAAAANIKNDPKAEKRLKKAATGRRRPATPATAAVR